MKTDLYRLTCLTNLHMGSGDINYSVIDLEVELDPVLKEPTMNSSGVKGALRDLCEQRAGDKDKRVLHVFGASLAGKESTQGAYTFFSGDLAARPVRVSSGNTAYTLATSPELIRHLQRKLSSFGIEGFTGDLPKQGESGLVCGTEEIKSVEGIEIGDAYADSALMEALLQTKNWTIMTAGQLKDIALPVETHNVLEDGKSRNLWYEQIVPHESVFFLLIGRPEEEGDSPYSELDQLLGISREKTWQLVQFGAGASTGNGFVKMEKVLGGEA